MGKGEVTRHAILEHATSLASKVGLEGLSIGTLADALGLSKSGLFAHFKSKEALQVQVLEHAAERFVDAVVKPALKEPRGEPRLRALFERFMIWPRRKDLPGGCPFVAATAELDDRPGPARDLLVRQQRDWLETIATVAKTCVTEGHFRTDVDPDQVAYELQGIELAYHHAARLLGDARAEERARAAFESLVARSRAKRR